MSGSAGARSVQGGGADGDRERDPVGHPESDPGDDREGDPEALCLRIRGDAQALANALDVLLVRADVRAIVEADGAFDVRLGAPLGPLATALGAIHVEVLTHDGAATTGTEGDAPIRVGARIVVRPPWVARPAALQNDAIELVVPRGMAFGSGEHDSTQAALLLLDELWPERGPASFADVGCGSGILALYAVRRGARRVLACDVDAAAVRLTQELVPAADVRCGGPECLPPGSADLVVANLDGTQLRAALPHLLALWSGRDVLVLSGMRRAEEGAIAAIAAMPPVARVARGDFVALGFRAR